MGNQTFERDRRVFFETITRPALIECATEVRVSAVDFVTVPIRWFLTLRDRRLLATGFITETARSNRAITCFEFKHLKRRFGLAGVLELDAAIHEALTGREPIFQT